jgi:hypothetical protein
VKKNKLPSCKESVRRFVLKQRKIDAIVARHVALEKAMKTLKLSGEMQTIALKRQIDDADVKPEPVVASVDRWYDRHQRSWVVVRKDAEGNQIGDAFYDGVRKGAVAMEKQWCLEHSIPIKTKRKIRKVRLVAIAKIGGWAVAYVERRRGGRYWAGQFDQCWLRSYVVAWVKAQPHLELVEEDLKLSAELHRVKCSVTDCEAEAVAHHLISINNAPHQDLPVCVQHYKAACEDMCAKLGYPV